MILIVGLGNPGQKFQKTRHNVGFQVIDELAKKSPLFTHGAKNFVLQKPKTFMNLSGKAVKRLITIYHLPVANLWVVHDDIDLPLGKFKIQKGRGSAGHKGVESVIRELGTKNFWRVRIGICPEVGKPRDVEKFVLQKLTKEEEKILKRVIKEAIQELKIRSKKG